MIGNDVIDIIQSRKESNWQRKGFLQKLFTTREQLLIETNPEPEIMVWLLWSMKEAAYKIFNRQTKIRAYIPKKLVCTIVSQNENFITGHVTYDKNVYHTKTILSQLCLHTIAVSSFADLNNVIEIEKKSILKDKNGIPYLYNKILNVYKDVSISHHGRFKKVVMINS